MEFVMRSPAFPTLFFRPTNPPLIAAECRFVCSSSSWFFLAPYHVTPFPRLFHTPSAQPKKAEAFPHLPGGKPPFSTLDFACPSLQINFFFLGRGTENEVGGAGKVG